MQLYLYSYFHIGDNDFTTVLSESIRNHNRMSGKGTHYFPYKLIPNADGVSVSLL